MDPRGCQPWGVTSGVPEGDSDTQRWEPSHLRPPARSGRSAVSAASRTWGHAARRSDSDGGAEGSGVAGGAVATEHCALDRPGERDGGQAGQLGRQVGQGGPGDR